MRQVQTTIMTPAYENGGYFSNPQGVTNLINIFMHDTSATLIIVLKSIVLLVAYSKLSFFFYVIYLLNLP